MQPDVHKETMEIKGQEPTDISLDVGEQTAIDWTQSEERKVRWKLDLLLKPLLLCGFFALQLDRSNISNALTSSIVEDLHLPSKDTISSGNQLQMAAIVIFEIPSNILLQKIGSPIWITFEIIIWGLISLFQAFVTNKSSYYATRFLLGMFEAGFVPAYQFIMSIFYKRDELAIRTSIFYIGNYFATGTGSLMAAGIFHLDGKCNLAGWQWLFIIDGTFTVIIGFIYVLLLPKSPSYTRPLFGLFGLFSDRDRHIMHNRIIIDDPKKNVSLSQISIKDVARSLMNFNTWGHLFINILSLAPSGGLRLYSPTVIKSLGFDTTKANALSSGNSVSQGINDSWMSINARTPQERSVGLAMVVMGANLGGLAGQSLFEASDAPRYNNAFLAILCLYAASLVVVVWQIVAYWRANKKLAKREDAEEVAHPDSMTAPSWKYKL